MELTRKETIIANIKEEFKYKQSKKNGPTSFEDYLLDKLADHRMISHIFSDNGMNSPHPDKMHYNVWKFIESDKEFQIDGRNLVYTQLGDFHHGCQCNHVGGTEEHKLITENLLKICDLFIEIEELNKI